MPSPEDEGSRGGGTREQESAPGPGPKAPRKCPRRRGDGHKGKFPPVRKAGVGSAPPGRSLALAGAERGAGTISWAPENGAGLRRPDPAGIFRAAGRGATVPRRGSEPSGCFQLSSRTFFGVFSDLETPLLAANHTAGLRRAA